MDWRARKQGTMQTYNWDTVKKEKMNPYWSARRFMPII